MKFPQAGGQIPERIFFIDTDSLEQSMLSIHEAG